MTLPLEMVWSTFLLLFCTHMHVGISFLCFYLLNMYFCSMWVRADIYKGCDGAAQKQTAANMSTSVAIDFSSSRAYQAKSKTKNKFHNFTLSPLAHLYVDAYVFKINYNSMACGTY